MKLYSGYYSLHNGEVKFKIGVIEAKNSEVFSNTYELDSYYFTAPDYSTCWFQDRDLDTPLNLKFGTVMYSFDLEKIRMWISDVRNEKLKKAKDYYESLRSSVIEEEF